MAGWVYYLSSKVFFQRERKKKTFFLFFLKNCNFDGFRKKRRRRNLEKVFLEEFNQLFSSKKSVCESSPSFFEKLWGSHFCVGSLKSIRNIQVPEGAEEGLALWLLLVGRSSVIHRQLNWVQWSATLVKLSQWLTDHHPMNNSQSTKPFLIFSGTWMFLKDLNCSRTYHMLIAWTIF